MKKIVIMAFAIALILGISPTSFTTNKAEAAGDRFYDYSEMRWRPMSENPRNRSRHFSNKSPVRRKKVSFRENYSIGTIVIDTSERRLYHIVSKGRAVKYGIGVGRDGFTWAGKHKITRKAEWPGWTPPEVMRRREAAKGKILPRYVPGGPENPLGARAMYIGSTIYRIHGTNQPWTIGQAMSSGCIRMANDDVEHLYAQVNVGAKVVVRH